ncbi:unnamed protein product [Strongylus vulgaris]|uniref:Uncharacterized protein n=1 Tax=Strongylus vulgaris TaxID=40348 RepID=A0A3P7IHJ6_STRVU|nr:unnamed protein product [Strongylus vulgaris]
MSRNVITIESWKNCCRVDPWQFQLSIVIQELRPAADDCQYWQLRFTCLLVPELPRFDTVAAAYFSSPQQTMRIKNVIANIIA